MRLLSWLLLAAAIAILGIGLIVDGTTQGTGPNLTPFYGLAIVLGLAGMLVGLRRLGDRR